ncbi:MAG: Gfo/Idh/MocA family oxidoreductase [Verrucomicrobia bacterium]|nr:Gfo/Idh/MocA family oxidoreductase [Verrucomicrobiota bacterium]MCG2679304.1 Gfo/Idh/MocA family oxidoreductase [Kiritimatiellia bacterium]MBU4247319.1 Gfo/Idh/MocA family oxidoreductase [Verrucomicrobiota bacterium]MBU4292259.1 Gfo/Idh/MocA family oxidoreductase [Verrucomicrobiota bacterium]MBU4428279.1 Gfo/Idh/MocA family oxidoreductase [Verrucomicrobiota bacterium]
MSDFKVRVGVVGVGSLGQWHARIYSELPTAELVGVYDINVARAEEIAARYRTRVFRDMAGLAAAVQAASIVVPADKHFEAASLFLERGVHLLVEKPIATRTADAEQMVAAAQARNLILQVGHVERFNPVMRFLEGILIRPRFIEAHRLAPYPPARKGQAPRGTEVSVVLDLMIHDLEVILHLVRSPVREIHAVGIPVLSPSEDIANVRLSFENGCVANVTTSRISPESMRKIRVFQEDTYISLDYQNQTGELYRKLEGKIERSRVPIEKGEALLNELASFVECVRTRGEPVVSGQGAAEALKLAADICRHIREHAS